MKYELWFSSPDATQYVRYTNIHLWETVWSAPGIKTLQNRVVEMVPIQLYFTKLQRDMHGRSARVLTHAALLILRTLLQWHLSFQRNSWAALGHLGVHHKPCYAVFFKIQCGGSDVGKSPTYVNSWLDDTATCQHGHPISTWHLEKQAQGQSHTGSRLNEVKWEPEH